MIFDGSIRMTIRAKGADIFQQIALIGFPIVLLHNWQRLRQTDGELAPMKTYPTAAELIEVGWTAFVIDQYGFSREWAISQPMLT